MSNHSSSTTLERASTFSAGVLEAIILGGDYAGRKAAQGAVWAARRAPMMVWWPIRGAGRVLANFWRFCLPQYDNPPASRYQAQARATRAFTGFAGFMLTLIAGAPLAWVLALWLLPPVLVAVGLVAGFVGLVYAGRPHAETEAVEGPRKLTAEQVELTKALAAIFPKVNAALKEDPSALNVGRFEVDWATGTRGVGIALPYGATAGELAKHPEAIAHAIARATGQPVAADQIAVRQGGHPGEATIYVSADSPSNRPAPSWQLANAARSDLTKPLTIGEDLQGKPVSVRLFGTDERGRLTGGSMVIGGVSGSGKTTLLRLIVGTAALDPRAVIAVADLKGDHDFRPLDPALDWHRVEDTPDNLADLKVMIAQALAHMRAVQNGTADRVPVLIVIDECQEVFGKGKDKELAGMVEQLVRRGRSSGIFTVVATQRPTSDSIPTSLRDNTRDQVCFRVTNQTSAASVLDQLAYVPETDASRISPDAAGTGVVNAVGFQGMAMMANVTSAMAGRAARRHPRSRGQLFGTPEPQPVAVEQPQAPFQTYPDGPVGVQVDPEPVPANETDIIRHVDDVWPDDDRDRMATAELSWRLAIIHPDYAGIDPAGVTRRLRAAGVDPGQIKIGGKTARGVYRAQIEQALRGGAQAGVEGVEGA